MKNVTFDLHASEWAEGNIQTEYERNFSAKGFKINRLEAYKQEK
jgi:tRNA (guanine-N7-)-methyltransferase